MNFNKVNGISRKLKVRGVCYLATWCDAVAAAVAAAAAAQTVNSAVLIQHFRESNSTLMELVLVF